MGRQNKVDLPYFELDCHMDDKVKLIQAEFGLKGFAVIVKLYQRIYGGEFGYYCEWDEERLLLFTLENGLNGDGKNLIKEIVSTCIKRNIFSERLFKEYGILTSSGVQKQYLKATAKREIVEMKKEYLLITIPENRNNVVINSISSTGNHISDGRNTQSRVNKSKSIQDKTIVYDNKPLIPLKGEEDKKETEKQMIERVLKEYNLSDYILESINDWIEYKKERRFIYKEKGFKSLLKQITDNVRKYGEEAVRNVILDSMANGYQGIIFDKLRKNDVSGGTRKINKKGGEDYENAGSNHQQDSRRSEIEAMWEELYK